MKKKLLFIMPSMNIGGAERSLLGLFHHIDTERYEIFLFLYRHDGEFLKLIPDYVHIIPAIRKYETFDVPIISLLRSKNIAFGLMRIIGKIRFTLLAKKKEYGIWAAMQYTSRSILPLLPLIPGEYDAAISFLGIPDVLLYKTTASKKIAWNHTDYSILGPDRKYDIKIYNQLDKIISVSDSCTKQFLSVYPELEKKAITIENTLSYDFIFGQAAEVVDDFNVQENEISLLSIGRFSEAKNFDNIPIICKMLIERKLPIKWFLIGYGGDELLIRRKIKEAEMEEHVIILGKRENPYPYIAKCDFYIQPSRYEGKCVSVIEAQILNKPVIITDYATSNVQLQDGFDGIIVPLDNEGCAEGIEKVIRDFGLVEQLVKNTGSVDYSNIEQLKILEKEIEWQILDDDGGSK